MAMKLRMMIMLTDMKLRRLKPGLKTIRIADRDGLAAEIRRSGNIVFIFRFQWEKKPQTITVGPYPIIGLAEARNIALKLRILVKQGIDPRIAGSPKEEKLITLKDAAELWYQKNCINWKDRTKTLHHRSLTRDIYPVIGDIPIDKVSKSKLLFAIHPHESAGHYEIAHRLHDRLKTIFDFALAAGMTENYPFIGLKKALTPKPKIRNQLAISSTEAHDMLKKIAQLKSSEIVKIYVELLAHLFVRPAELRLAKWSEFNLQLAEWNIPTDRMKMKSSHWVPLSPQALNIIKKLRLITGFTPFLFNSPNPSHKQPISETSARKLLQRAGYKNRHTLHGFRALASTVLHEQSIFRTDAIEAQLAHKVQGVRGVYLRADFKKERRELMEWYSDWLELSSTKNCVKSLEKGL